MPMIREHPGGAQGSQPEWIGLPFSGRLGISGSESLQVEEKEPHAKTFSGGKIPSKGGNSSKE